MAGAIIAGTVVGLMVLLIGFGMAMSVREENERRPRRPTRRQVRREQQELRVHREFLRRMHRSALDHAQVAPYAQIFLDELTTHMKNANEIEAR